MLRNCILVFALLIAAAAAKGQSSGSAFGTPTRPMVGGAGLAPPAQSPTIGAARGSEILRHRGPTGKPCLTVGGFARPHTVNANLYDHVITVTNSCARRLAIQVCYYDTSDCIPIEIPGGERKQAVLGTLPSIKDFRFEFREKL